MKHLLVCLVLSLLQALAFAARKPGPYQSVLLFYAYQMEYLALGKGGITIAPACSGQGPDNICEFDEFLRHIQVAKRKSRRWGGHTTVGSSLTPDVENAADELEAGTNNVNNGLYSNKFDMAAIFPGSFVGQTAGDYTKLMSLLATAVQNTIKQAKSDGKSAALKPYLDEFNRAADSLGQRRMLERSEGMIKDLDDLVKANGGSPAFSVATRPVNPQNGPTYNEIDVGTTRNRLANEAATFQTAVTDYLNNLNNDGGYKVRRVHMAAIVAVQDLQNVIATTPC